MARCKTDVYFLADNTGSMGNVIDEIQANATAMVNAIAALPGVDAVFGVGNYQDFPVNAYSIYYGGQYPTTVPIRNLTVPVGATLDIPFALGPTNTQAWPATTATYASPVTTITLPTGTGFLRMGYSLILEWDGSLPSGSVTVECISSTIGVRATHTTGLVGPTSPFMLNNDFLVTPGQSNITLGETEKLQITNNTDKTLYIRWDSSWYTAINATAVILLNPYAYLHQLSPTTDTVAVADAFTRWRADRGLDYPEGWLYALDQLSEATFWRTGTYKLVVILGDAPPHDPICTAISGLAYTIDEASITAKLLLNNIVVVAASVNVATTGLDDTDDEGDYLPYCGLSTILAGHGTRITTATGGYILQQPDPNEAANTIVALITLALGDCRNMSMPFATVVGAN